MLSLPRHRPAEVNILRPQGGTILSRQEAGTQYQDALKQGRKTYRERILHGQYPYPQVLDEILDDAMTAPRPKAGGTPLPPISCR